MSVLKFILRIIGILLLPVITPVFLLTTFTVSLFISIKKEYHKDSAFVRFLLNFGAWYFVNVVCNVKTVVSGRENLPDGKFLAVCNHRSNFDPILSWLTFRKNRFAFISKKSNFKIFIFGKLVHRCGFTDINREDPREAIKTINYTANQIKNGEFSVFVYPEGTRSKSKEMLPFHDGVLKIAKKANSPVAVISIDNTELIYKRAFFRKTVVHIDVLKIIDVETVGRLSSGELGEQARDLIENHLNG